jgi:large subunit ribosomal protein L6
MSRKGKLPIPMPKGVDVKVSSDEVIVKGPKGTLKQALHPCIDIAVTDGEIHVLLREEHQDKGNIHGLYRSLICNMVDGTVNGFLKELEMVGVGYRAAVQGQMLDLQIGKSHQNQLPIPEGVQVKIDKHVSISITGIDKQKVGQFAATIRAKRPPEPYQGKGIRYKGEYVRRKAGKAAAKK